MTFTKINTQHHETENNSRFFVKLSLLLVVIVFAVSANIFVMNTTAYTNMANATKVTDNDITAIDNSMDNNINKEVLN